MATLTDNSYVSGNSGAMGWSNTKRKYGYINLVINGADGVSASNIRIKCTYPTDTFSSSTYSTKRNVTLTIASGTNNHGISLCYLDSNNKWQTGSSVTVPLSDDDTGSTRYTVLSKFGICFNNYSGASAPSSATITPVKSGSTYYRHERGYIASTATSSNSGFSNSKNTIIRLDLNIWWFGMFHYTAWIENQDATVTLNYSTVYKITYKNSSNTIIYTDRKKSGETITLRNHSMNFNKNDTEIIYTITYNANGGSGAPASNNAIITSSYTPKGWSTSNGGSKVYNYGANYSTNSNLTLYPCYTESSISTWNCSSLEPTLSGKIFAGWSTSSSGTVIYNSGKTYIDKIYSSQTLYAVWVTGIKATLNANGGFCDKNSVALVSGVEAVDLLPTPVRPGYKFKGWAYDLSNSGYITFGTSYKYSDYLSIHMDIYKENWNTSETFRPISCTQSGGFALEHNNGYLQFAEYKNEEYKLYTSNFYIRSLTPGWHSFDCVSEPSGARIYVDDELVIQGYHLNYPITYNTSNGIFLNAEAGPGTMAPESENDFGNALFANVSIRNTNQKTPEGSTRYFSVPIEDIILYAQWEKEEIYPIKIYTQGGWKNAFPYVYKDGEWKELQLYYYANNKWNILERQSLVGSAIVGKSITKKVV